MEREAKAAADKTARIYEDFDPETTWVLEAGRDTLVLQLQDFTKDQLRVQVTTLQKLRISGERPVGNNKWKRFHKEMPIASIYDSDQISARFENFKLHVILPKLGTAPHDPAKPESSPPADKPATARDSVQAQAQATQRLPSKTGNGAVEKKQDVGDNANWSSQAANIPQKTASMEKQRGENKPSGDASAGSQMGTGEREEARQDVPSDTNAEKTSGKASRDANAADGDQNAKIVPRKSTEGAEMEKFKYAGASNDGVGKSRAVVEGLKQGVGFLVRELKNSRTLKNLAVAVLFLLVSLLYARNAMKSITGKSSNDL